ncbi:porin [Methylobacterium trifolii]|uniref:Porin n=1 Tax=Methylobacterium trifolii TaxID=1003092 RepID=A0ABQ4TSY6_9HYPH|nr:porin [Methylobacterium trifolii]GJE58426.1 hypothetical protein MPOCJGCO_0507 [Methylobacterium trifolii]
MMRAVCGAILAALAATGPVRARDLAKAPAPETAKPCPAYGAGFVRLPGSSTCTRLSGRVSAGADLRAGRDGTATAPTAAGRFAIDTRTESDLGPVRTFVRIGNGRH